MFRTREINQLKALIDPNINADDVLNADEKTALTETTKVESIRDRIHVPQHKKHVKTITLIKVVTSDFDCALFLESVIKCLTPVYELRVGLSFFMSNHNKYSYVHSVVARPVNDPILVTSYDDATSLTKYFKGFSYDEYLDLAFISRNKVNPFDKSGYIPRKLVCMTVWIKKGQLT